MKSLIKQFKKCFPSKPWPECKKQTGHATLGIFGMCIKCSNKYQKALLKKLK